MSSWYPQLATYRGRLVAAFVDTRPGLSGRLAFRISDDNGQTWGATFYPFGSETFNGTMFAPRVVADRDTQTLRVFSGSGIPLFRSSTDPDLVIWTAAAPAGNGTMRPATANSCSASSPECFRAHSFSFMETATPGRWIYIAKSPAGFGQSGRGTQVGTLGGSWSAQVDHGGSGGLTGCCGHSTATTMLDRDGNILFLRSRAAFIPLAPLALSTDNIYYRKSTNGGLSWGPFVTAYSPELKAHTTGAPVGLYVPGYSQGEYVWYTGWYPHASVEHAARVIPIWTGAKPYAETGTVRLFGSAGGDLPDPNTAPSIELAASAETWVGDEFTVHGTFADPDVDDSWTLTAAFGDASIDVVADRAEDGSFSVSHVYERAGTYSVSVQVVDAAGAIGSASVSVLVRPDRSFLFVHGIRGSFRDDSSFVAILGSLRQRYGQERVRIFEYFQDVGYFVDGRCVDMPAARIPSDSGGLPLTLSASSLDPNVCDSQSDVGLNAILLDKEVRDLASEHSSDVTLIANSMGAAITRSFLAYSVAAATTAYEHVDEVYFLQGAQQGSYLAYPPSWLSGLRDEDTQLERLVGEAVSTSARSRTGWDPTRPAAGDLRPKSDTYMFVNPNPDHIPDEVGYFNVASDIRWTVELGVLDWRFRRLVGASAGFGDYVILPGTDRPTDVSPMGAARFDPASIGRGRPDSHQWILEREHSLQVTTLVALLQPFALFRDDLLVLLGDPFSLPESHLQLGAQSPDGTPRMREILVTDPVLGDRRSLDEVILRQIARQDQ